MLNEALATIDPHLIVIYTYWRHNVAAKFAIRITLRG
jgi:hypothetical protein